MAANSAYYTYLLPKHSFESTRNLGYLLEVLPTKDTTVQQLTTTPTILVSPKQYLGTICRSSHRDGVKPQSAYRSFE